MAVLLCFHFTCATFLTLNNSIEDVATSLVGFLF